jgi:RNA polymerase-binding transcription factor DksA
MSTDTTAMPRHRTLTDAQLSVFRSMLEEQWRHQLGDIVELSYDALSAVDGRDEVGARTTDQLLNSQLVAAARQQLQETEDALARLDEGAYGNCGSCGDPVSPARLEILPAARLCVTCQSRRTAR